MRKLSKRQNEILGFIQKKGPVGNKQIREYLEGTFGEIGRVTVVRDIEQLLGLNLIIKAGQGRSVVYKEAVANKLLTYFDPQKYFEKPQDQRELAHPGFNFEIFDYFSDELFSQDELAGLEEENKKYRERVKKISPTILKKELERLTIELSWKSSRIEGNTYSLIDTEILIKEHKEAVGHSKEEAIMILNHKKAIDYILDKQNDFRKLSLAKIEDVHKLIVKDLGVTENVRRGIVGITGTNFRPLDNDFQIREALESMIKLVNISKLHPLTKTLAIILIVSYIQPFEDGNKRTARILGNAVLLAHKFCSLSYRSIDEGDYKKAILLFYEQNSARFFKELFIDQFRFAIDNYFLV